MDVRARFSVVLKVSKVVKWSRIFVHSIRGLPNFLEIPIMNPLTRVHEKLKRSITYSTVINTLFYVSSITASGACTYMHTSINIKVIETMHSAGVNIINASIFATDKASKKMGNEVVHSMKDLQLYH